MSRLMSHTAGLCRRSVCRLALLTFALTGVVGCAGYQIGQQALYRPDIRSVHVPVFESNSFRRSLGERLTEAVATEIDLRTPYRVAPADRADSFLRGRILYDRKKVIAEDVYDVPRVIDAQLVAQVDWVGPQGELLTNTITVPIDAFQLRISDTDTFIPEAGQGVTTALQETIQQIARDIVSQMEMPPW